MVTKNLTEILGRKDLEEVALALTTETTGAEPVQAAGIRQWGGRVPQANASDLIGH